MSDTSSQRAVPDEGAASPRALDTSMTEVWRQSAWWYLAGLEDGRPRTLHSEGLSEHGPTTPKGKEFVALFVEACEREWAGNGTGWPYLPDFYAEWAKR